MSEWQPIDSAPKDGQIVLFDTSPHPMTFRWSHVIDGWVLMPGEVYIGAPRAKLWMPLPKPPSGDT